MKLTIINQQGEKVGQEEIKLPPSSKVDLKKVILSQLANQHQRTLGAKSRGQVKGSNQKPWRQKGTGRARAGSRKSPLWIGGGVTFAPQPRKKTVRKINQKEKRLAIKTLLAEKIKNQDVILIEDFTLDKPNTQAIAKLLTKLNPTSPKTLLVVAKPNQNIQLSCRNINNLSSQLADNLSLLDLARHQKILLFKSSLKTWL